MVMIVRISYYKWQISYYRGSFEALLADVSRRERFHLSLTLSEYLTEYEMSEYLTEHENSEEFL